jgi:hypothetical protein
MKEVGGWPTVAGIYTFFAGLVFTGWAAGRPGASVNSAMRGAGRAATGLIGAMFVGTYLGQFSQSRWYALPAALVGTAEIAYLVAGRASRTGVGQPVVGEASPDTGGLG